MIRVSRHDRPHAVMMLGSKGPAFYRQLRVGLLGQAFRVASRAIWARKDDPRITRVVLRPAGAS